MPQFGARQHLTHDAFISSSVSHERCLCRIRTLLGGVARYIDGDDDGSAGMQDVRSVQLSSGAADSPWAGDCSNVEYLVEHFYLTCDYPKYDPEGGGTGRDISVTVTVDGQTGTLLEGFSYIDDSGCVG